jgi:MerR family copper efflux transcriptional regulator
MLIGEVSKRSRVPTKTIRYYEDIGLMPAPARRESGYRDYEESAVGRLSFIRAAQSIGLTLGEIREIAAFRDRGEAPCTHVSGLIERHAAELAERIAALQEMQQDLTRLAKRARSSAHHAGEAAYCHIIEDHAQRSAS